ncbi:MAG: terminase gpA endonuclease subunit [Spirochaetia bacterium]|jgi:hypothetical protein
MNELGFFDSILDLFPIAPPPRSIFDYVQGKRIMGGNTPWPGFWDGNRTPFWKEVLEVDLSPFSPVRHEVIMCSSQIGKTSNLAENTILYYIGACPTEILYVTATENLADEFSIKRLDPALESMGLEKRIFAQTTSRRSRLSGNTVRSKSYMSGSINICSAQSASDLRSASKKILIRDEVDSAPAELKLEGSWLKVSEARTAAFGSRAKILDISTPTTFLESPINKMYEAGDCRKFCVNCPRCGKEQVLEFGSRETAHGLKGKFKGGELVEAVYVCVHCRGEIQNNEKAAMIATGRWIATKKSSNPFLVSRHLSALYSPFMSWTELYRKWLESEGSAEDMRAFTNLLLGEPFRESGTRPTLSKVISLRGSYASGVVPGKMAGDVFVGPLYITFGVDVQQGVANDPDQPPRLEISVVGTGNHYRTWEICHRVFPGPVDNAHAGAWEDLNKWALAGGLNPVRADGMRWQTSFGLFDSGYLPDVVQKFSERWEGCAPSKDFGWLLKQKGEKADVPGPRDYKRYRITHLGGNTRETVEFSRNWYLRVFYNCLNVARALRDPQPPSFCEFPYDYTEEQFEQLRAYEMRSDGSFVKVHGRTEMTSCHLMAMVAGDVFIDKAVQEKKLQARAAGASAFEIEKIDHRYLLAVWERAYPWKTQEQDSQQQPPQPLDSQQVVK